MKLYQHLLLYLVLVLSPLCSLQGQMLMVIAAAGSTAAVPAPTVTSCQQVLAAATTSNIDTTGANFIVLTVSYGASAPTITENKGNGSPTALTAYNTGTPHQRVYYWTNPTTGSGHNFTFSQNVGVCISAWSNMATSSVLDAGMDSGSGSASATCLPGSLTPSSGGQRVVITGLLHEKTSGSPTIDSPFTPIDGSQIFVSGQTYGQAIAHEVQANGGSARNPTWSAVTAVTVCAMAVFKGQ